MNDVFKNIDNMLIDINDKHRIYNFQDKSNITYYNYLIICLSQIILDKKIFKRNKYLIEFMENNYKFEYPEYIKKSRMLILGRTIQLIIKIDNMEDIKIFLNRTYKALSMLNNNELDINKIDDWQDAISRLKL